MKKFSETESPSQPLQEQGPTEETSIKESVFASILKNGGTPVEATINSIDLQKKRDEIVEGAVKEAAMSAREVLLEQNRARDILQKKIKSLENPQVFEEYCEKLGLSLGVSEDLKTSLPNIIQAIESLKFQSELGYDDHEEYVDAYIRSNVRFSLWSVLQEKDSEQLISGIIENEIDGALKILSDARKRPVLAHRVRGFGKSESSREALTRALEENVAEIEFDIRAGKVDETGKGCPMICHNYTLGALAGRPEAIRDLTEAQLKEVTLTSGEHLASLKDLFEIVKQQKNEVTKLNIDIKDFDEKMLDQIHDLIKEYSFEHRVVIVSWFPQALQYLYEKDPTLSYSLSYYPKIRGLSRWLIEKIERLPQGEHLFGRIGTWFAKQWAIKGTFSETAGEAIVISAETHWKNLKEEGVGKHTFGYAERDELNGEKEGAIMSRVLHNGSVNIAVAEEFLAKLFPRMLVPKSVRNYILNLLGRSTSVRKFADDLRRNGIKVNFYDLKSEKALETHFESFEEGGIEPGVVYSSKSDLVPRLKL